VNKRFFALAQGFATAAVFLVIAVTAASCATSGMAQVRDDEGGLCAPGEVMVCDHVSRIKNVERNCLCQPKRQTLNTIEH
jgi:hypothetical protein